MQKRENVRRLLRGARRALPPRMLLGSWTLTWRTCGSGWRPWRAASRGAMQRCGRGGGGGGVGQRRGGAGFRISGFSRSGFRVFQGFTPGPWASGWLADFGSTPAAVTAVTPPLQVLRLMRQLESSQEAQEEVQARCAGPVQLF
jgi:hypothetical protein